MEKNKYRVFTAGADDAGRRIDRIIRKLVPDLKLSRIYSALRKGDIRLNGKRTKPGTSVQAGDKISVYEPLLPASFSVQPTNVSGDGKKTNRGTPPDISSAVLFENDNILVLNKPRGITVHGDNSLVQAVFSYLGAPSRESLAFRPGPLHRLDKYTTGLLLFGKSLLGSRTFSEILRNHECVKTYIGVIQGELNDEQVWKDVVATNGKGGSKEAVTRATPLLTPGKRTLCMFTISTGRRHQIRRQAAEHGVPLVGDARYGGSKGYGEFILHAYKMSLTRFNDVLGFRELTAPVPKDAKKRLRRWFGPDFSELPFSDNS